MSGGMNVKKGLVMFAYGDGDDAIDEAKKYIKRFNLTNEQVKIVREDGVILVKAKKDFRFE